MSDEFIFYDRVQPASRSLASRLFHWGPIVAISIIFCISVATLICLQEWWPPLSSAFALGNLILFMLWNFMTLTNLFTAANIGPGYVPFGWTRNNLSESELSENLQYCVVCEGYKAPRSHHCRKCKRCVMKMDHHCPWINNCVGHRNQSFFMRFLVSAVFGCSHAAAILIPSIYRACFRVWYIHYGTGKEPLVNLGLYQILLGMFAFGLAIGVVVAVGFLFFIQLRSVLRNRTGIEDWILVKAKHRNAPNSFDYPYDLGRRQNFWEVCTLSGHPESDGFTWPITEGSDQYTLTREQIAQKEEKKHHTYEYVAVENYSGSIFPITKGFLVALCPPLSDEARIALRPDDHIMVTRHKKRWLYGEKFIAAPGSDSDYSDLGSDSEDEGASGDTGPKYIPRKNRPRGWFPRRCVRELRTDESSDSDNDEKVPENAGDGIKTNGTEKKDQ